MKINRYEEMDETARDVMREIGSIGTGNAATALSALLQVQVQMSLPDVKILDFNEAVEYAGCPEDVATGVYVQLSGDVQGVMLFLMKLDFINEVLKNVLGETISDYSEMNEMKLSALIEVGNIIISSYVSSLSSLTSTDVSLSVPAFSINMLGAILAVPMVEFGYESDKVMMISGKCAIGGRHVESNLLMMPDIESLNLLLERLVNPYE